MLEAHNLMFTMSDNQQLKSLAEPKTGLTALEEHLPGSMYSEPEPACEQTVMIKLEPNVEDFQTRSGPDSGAGAPDQSRLWASGVEKSGEATEPNICVLVPDVRYPLSPASEVADEQQGQTSPIKAPPFMDHKENEAVLTSDQYSVMGIHSTSCDMSLAPELQDQQIVQEVAVNEYGAVSDGTFEGCVFEFDPTASSNHENSCGQDTNGQNCFICSSCGKSFDSFSLFQRHQCGNIPELPFGCKICGKMFNQMSILKLHLKLHVE